MVDYRCAWGEHRVYFTADDGAICRVPANWTDVPGVDPFVLIAGERSPFRFDDLVELVHLLDGMSAP